jgi:hypothetical protein
MSQKFYCHECAARMKLMNPVNPENFAGTPYQLEKFIKHTAPTDSYPVVSIFDDSDYESYRTYIVNTSGSGCLMIDDQGRSNLIWVAGYQVGVTFKGDKPILPDDAIKVVFHNNEWKIHAFPIISDPIITKRCANCGRLVIS